MTIIPFVVYDIRVTPPRTPHPYRPTSPPQCPCQNMDWIRLWELVHGNAMKNPFLQTCNWKGGSLVIVEGGVLFNE